MAAVRRTDPKDPKNTGVARGEEDVIVVVRKDFDPKPL